MAGRSSILFTVIVSLALLSASCSEDHSLESTSQGGAVLITGVDINEEREIVTPQEYFKANEDFYFYYHNNRPFASEQIVVQLIDSRNDRVIAASDYDVDPEAAAITDMIWFGNPGIFKIAVIVDGQVMATQEVQIE